MVGLVVFPSVLVGYAVPKWGAQYPRLTNVRAAATTATGEAASWAGSMREAVARAAAGMAARAAPPDEMERTAADKVEVQKVADEKAAVLKVEAEKAPAEKAAAEKRAAEKVAAEKAAAEEAAAEKAAAEKAAAEEAAAEKRAAEKVAAEKATVEKAAAERAAPSHATKLYDDFLSFFAPPPPAPPAPRKPRDIIEDFMSIVVPLTSLKAAQVADMARWWWSTTPAPLLGGGGAFLVIVLFAWLSRQQKASDMVQKATTKMAEKVVEKAADDATVAERVTGADVEKAADEDDEDIGFDLWNVAKFENLSASPATKKAVAEKAAEKVAEKVADEEDDVDFDLWDENLPGSPRTQRTASFAKKEAAKKAAAEEALVEVAMKAAAAKKAGKRVSLQTGPPAPPPRRSRDVLAPATPESPQMPSDKVSPPPRRSRDGLTPTPEKGAASPLATPAAKASTDANSSDLGREIGKAVEGLGRETGKAVSFVFVESPIALFKSSAELIDAVREAGALEQRKAEHRAQLEAARLQEDDLAMKSIRAQLESTGELPSAVPGAPPGPSTGEQPSAVPGAPPGPSTGEQPASSTAQSAGLAPR